VALRERVHLSVSPNPVVGGATVAFDLQGERRRVGLEIYDPAGRVVETLAVFGQATGGAVTWIPDDSAPRGVYFARLHGEGVSETVKFVFLR
jgi:uncharacterized protein YfaS (alpha-2-macroglobulin family)